MNERELFVSVSMPRDGDLVYIPLNEYIGSRFNSWQIAIINGIVKDLVAQKPSPEYTVGASGKTFWINIDRKTPEPFNLELQLYWRTSEFVP